MILDIRRNYGFWLLLCRIIIKNNCHDGATWYRGGLLIHFPQGFPGSNPGRGVNEV